MKLLGELVFYTLLILLPVNLGYHFFSDSAYIHGVLVDYYLPTVYLTDLLVIFLLLTWLVELLPKLRAAGWEFKSQKSCLAGGQAKIKGAIQNLKVPKLSISLYLYIFISLFLLWSGLSLLWAPLKDVALYRYARLWEGFFLALWIGAHVDLHRDFGKISGALLLGVFYESALAILQWFKGGSLFGYYFLGEQPYNSLTPGVAKTGFLGEVVVRSYGTFPHPNVLGGYLALLLPWLLWQLWNKRAPRWFWLTFLLALPALFFTFSRAAWLAATLGLVFLTFLRRWEQRGDGWRFWLGVVVGLLLLVGFYFSGTLNDPLSLTRREELNSLSWLMARRNLWQGVGWGSFMVRLEDFGRVSGWTRFLQPVHNIFLLVLAETGWPGFFLWVFFVVLVVFYLWRLWHRRKATAPSVNVIGPASATLQLLLRENGQDICRLSGLLLIGFGQIIFLGLADHYFLTLPQGGLLFWLMVGLVFSLASA